MKESGDSDDIRIWEEVPLDYMLISNETSEFSSNSSSPLFQTAACEEDRVASDIISQMGEERIFDQLYSAVLRRNSSIPRRANTWDQVFLLFNTKAGKVPKKEFERQKIIRGHKNILRHVLHNNPPTRNLVKFDRKNTRLLCLWEELKIEFNNHHSSLSELALTTSGPLVDGRGLRTNNEGEERTFNNSFIRKYFKSEGVKETWDIYVDLLFAEADCSLLCKKFRIRCCNELHSFECEESWELLKKYLKYGMLSSLYKKQNLEEILPGS